MQRRRDHNMIRCQANITNKSDNVTTKVNQARPFSLTVYCIVDIEFDVYCFPPEHEWMWDRAYKMNRYSRRLLCCTYPSTSGESFVSCKSYFVQYCCSTCSNVREHLLKYLVLLQVTSIVPGYRTEI